jgi:hypothetical protein
MASTTQEVKSPRASDEMAEFSTFEQILPHESEELRMVLPKGMRFALNPRLGGYGKEIKPRDTSMKTYDIVIDPNARTNMVKESLRYRPDAASKHDELTTLPRVRFNDAVRDAIVDERHQRTVFRRERIQKFNTHKHVPALVTDRLVPCWRYPHSLTKQKTPAALALRRLQDAVAATAPENAERTKVAKMFKKSSRRQYGKKSAPWAYVTPTVSAAMKRQEKVDPAGDDWRVVNVSTARELLHPRIAAFDNGGAGPIWDEIRERKIKEHQESKEQWLAHDVLPGGKGISPLAEEIKEIRQQSQDGLQSLEKKYGRRREAFRKLPDLGATQSFDKYCKEYKKKAKLAEEQAAKKEVEEKPTFSPLAGALSLGLSKHRHAISDTDAPRFDIQDFSFISP